MEEDLPTRTTTLLRGGRPSYAEEDPHTRTKSLLHGRNPSYADEDPPHTDEGPPHADEDPPTRTKTLLCAGEIRDVAASHLRLDTPPPRRSPLSVTPEPLQARLESSELSCKSLQVSRIGGRGGISPITGRASLQSRNQPQSGVYIVVKGR